MKVGNNFSEKQYSVPIFDLKTVWVLMDAGLPHNTLAFGRQPDIFLLFLH